MSSFIDYERDEIETIYELLDTDHSNQIRQYLRQINADHATTRSSSKFLNQRIKFR